jgi:hypothetical protein
VQQLAQQRINSRALVVRVKPGLEATSNLINQRYQRKISHDNVIVGSISAPLLIRMANANTWRKQTNAMSVFVYFGVIFSCQLTPKNLARERFLG